MKKLLQCVSALVVVITFSSCVLAKNTNTNTTNSTHRNDDDNNNNNPSSHIMLIPPDYCAWLEQENVNRKAPLLTGSRGILYVAGKDLPGNGPDATMPVQENETLGFTHAFFRDGRARGEAIVTDELTGTGHSMWGWEFWRNTRIAYGSLLLEDITGNTTLVRYPAPSSLKWRPDRLTVEYDLADIGIYIREVKWITNDDVLMDSIFVRGGNASYPFTSVMLVFDGSSYVNTKNIPTFDGDPPNIPTSQARNSLCDFNQNTNMLHVAEKGTAYAKTSFCPQTPQKYIQDCKAKVGPMMYDGMHVILAADKPFRNVNITEDSERRQLYSLSIPVDLDAIEPDVTLAWCMDDDEAAAKTRVQNALKNPDMQLDNKTLALNTFLHSQVPRFSCPDKRINKVYYHSWALYYMYMLNAKQGFESLPHTQTAVNNFLGLHAYDSRVYLPMSSWIFDLQHYAYGNVLAWNASISFLNAWNNTMMKGTTGDNLGHAWISPMNCSAVSGHPEGTWEIYQHGADRDQFLRPAYNLYSTLWGPDPHMNGSARSSINQLGGIAYNNLGALASMSAELSRPISEQNFWKQLQNESVVYAQLKPPDSYGTTCAEALQYTMARWNNDSWVNVMAAYNGMNRTCWQNNTIPLILNANKPDSNFEVSTIVAYWAFEGLFRHNFNAIELSLAHIEAMLRPAARDDDPWIVFPESWDSYGEPWGDQFYNWDGVVSLLMLERFAGMSYSILESESILTVKDWLPSQWNSLNISIPMRTSSSADTATWVNVSLSRDLDAKSKSITVANSPLRHLRLEVWLEGHEFVSATPSGFNATESYDRVTWTFGQSKSTTVSVTWK